MTEQQRRQALTVYGRKLVESGLVQGTWGNLSVRLDGRYMLTTPSGLDYMRLKPEDMVKTDLETLAYEGSLKPTSEKGIHAGIYRRRPDTGAVIHTHSRACAVFAAAHRSVPIEEESLRTVFGETVKLAAYALPGSEALCKNTIAALGSGSACIMANHGMICTGRTLEEAFESCSRLELYCRRYLARRLER